MQITLHNVWKIGDANYVIKFNQTWWLGFYYELTSYINISKRKENYICDMSMFLFERILIIQIDDNKDGVFDFKEMIDFLLGTRRAVE